VTKKHRRRHRGGWPADKAQEYVLDLIDHGSIRSGQDRVRWEMLRAAVEAGSLTRDGFVALLCSKPFEWDDERAEEAAVSLSRSHGRK
jgi:hypothetical protein